MLSHWNKKKPKKAPPQDKRATQTRPTTKPQESGEKDQTSGESRLKAATTGWKVLQMSKSKDRDRVTCAVRRVMHLWRLQQQALQGFSTRVQLSVVHSNKSA